MNEQEAGCSIRSRKSLMHRKAPVWWKNLGYSRGTGSKNPGSSFANYISCHHEPALYIPSAVSCIHHFLRKYGFFSLSADTGTVDVRQSQPSQSYHRFKLRESRLTTCDAHAQMLKHSAETDWGCPEAPPTSSGSLPVREALSRLRLGFLRK